MSPTFLLSFDCEGKWGFADGLDEHHRHHLNRAALTRVYDNLLDSLERFQIRASFAFVGALTLSPEQAAGHPHWFTDVPAETHAWLTHFRRDWQRQDTQGWFEPQLLERVRSRAQHEIACHGFTHLPLAEYLADRSTVHRELQTAQAVASLHGLRFQTLVYPRNLCGYPMDLPQFGFIGYRQGHVRPRRPWQRLANLLAECWPRQWAEADASSGQPIAIPTGHFLNWRHAVRRHIPPAVTLARWRHALDDALHHGGVVHLWSHPHNFLNGDGQLPLLEQILALVAERVRGGDLANPTMADYCRQRRDDGAP